MQNGNGAVPGGWFKSQGDGQRYDGRTMSAICTRGPRNDMLKRLGPGAPSPRPGARTESSAIALKVSSITRGVRHPHVSERRNVADARSRLRLENDSCHYSQFEIVTPHG